MINENRDTAYYEKKFQYLCGVDEAGRGPWAGPVCCAAVILPIDHRIEGIQDSKKLSEHMREKLYKEITHKALAYHITSVSNIIIDKKNILQATLFGMKKSVQSLNITPDIILLDAVNISLPDIPQVNIIHGDQKSIHIAAASILAKVTRDRYMKKIDKKYPEYGFYQHKGYGTKQHEQALKQYGACPIHRHSFLPVKNVINLHQSSESSP